MIEGWIQIIADTLLLFSIGVAGWLVFSFLKLPVPGILGTMVFIGTLRILEVDIPYAPGFISPIVQIILGIFIGSKITKETVKDLKSLLKPAIVIIIWTMLIVFGFGYGLHRVTELDLFTSILSSSMGGLPEMTILSMETSADITVVVIMHTVRMMATMFLFPVIFKRFMVRGRKTLVDTVVKEGGKTSADQSKSVAVPQSSDSGVRRKTPTFMEPYIRDIKRFRQKLKALFSSKEKFVYSFKIRGVSIGLAALGGYVFYNFGVPAGGMVGAMVFIAVASIYGVRIKAPSSFTFEFLLIGIAITISDNFSSETMDMLTSGELILPVVLSTVVVFGTSILVAKLLEKITDWDFPTCFLAAAPAGFTVMSTLAIKYDKNPFIVSMLHLGRIMSIKLVVPFAFMILMG
ncbi:AbrB family transcriptional regulator [Isachenkonia alkalipeptolytica]|uniref:AbrB family transcriptional regulator n=1 Tax=Isachenkonia alkalipeptolytica TaxID=2565777 RepID=A0AA43XK39_9CLOT|nr:AbrB family transcriptional regulator [Isachenkonia alkalipeptolytica]NBG88360.1 AbrB family transcriptional regulator [Isachenkonia alkalipeptolytica]